jgi:hypothetical protein
MPADAVEAAGPDAVNGSELLDELQRRSAAYKNGEMTARPTAEVDRRFTPRADGREGQVNLRILAAAETETVQARDCLEGKVTGLTSRFLDDLAETFSAIGEQQLRFQRLETLPADQPYRRALLAVFPSAVVFEILTDGIVVVAVCHTSREPNYWLARRKT